MISINRKIFNTIRKADEAVLLDYTSDVVRSSLINELEYELDAVDINNVATGISEVIVRNENIIEKYGMDGYINEDYSAKEYVSGYYYKSGKIVVCPFDWSLDSNGDFDYTFILAKVL